MSSHCTRLGLGATSLGTSASVGSVEVAVSPAKKASEMRVPNASVKVRVSIGDANQSPTVYSQLGFVRPALGSAVIWPLFLFGPLRMGGCPEIAARRSIAVSQMEGELSQRLRWHPRWCDLIATKYYRKY